MKSLHTTSVPTAGEGWSAAIERIAERLVNTLGRGRMARAARVREEIDALARLPDAELERLGYHRDTLAAAVVRRHFPSV